MTLVISNETEDFYSLIGLTQKNLFLSLRATAKQSQTPIFRLRKSCLKEFETVC